MFQNILNIEGNMSKLVFLKKDYLKYQIRFKNKSNNVLEISIFKNYFYFKYCIYVSGDSSLNFNYNYYNSKIEIDSELIIQNQCNLLHNTLNYIEDKVGAENKKTFMGINRCTFSYKEEDKNNSNIYNMCQDIIEIDELAHIEYHKNENINTKIFYEDYLKNKLNEKLNTNFLSSSDRIT